VKDELEGILSGDLLKRALDESDHGIVVTDPEGTIQTVSERFVELSGYSASELVGSNPRLIRSGQTPDAMYRDLWETIRTGRTWKGAILNRRKDGTLFLDRESIIRGVGRTGDRACYVAIHRDSNVELDLRLKIAKAEANYQAVADEIDEAKSSINTLVSFTKHQLGSTAQSLIAAMEARDPYTAGHGRRTSLMIELVGDELGLFPQFSREGVRFGAILHDIGKIGVPDAILLKAGSLTGPEYEVIKTHPVVGFDILSLAFQEDEILRIVRSHHERLDGSGYPDRLRGPQIPDYVKAFSVCDCFDALTSSRSYRRALPAEDAISILTDDALTGRLDMSAVNAVRRLWKRGVLGDVKALPVAA